jgi:hypothetical protein
VTPLPSVIVGVPVRFLAEPLQESVGQVPDGAEPMLKLIQAVQEPVRSVPWPVVLAQRRAWRAGRPGWARRLWRAPAESGIWTGPLVVILMVVELVRFVRLVDVCPGLVGCFLRKLGSLLRALGLLASSLGSLPSLFGPLAHAVGPLLGSHLLGRVGPFLCHLSGLFGHPCSLFGLICCFLGLLGEFLCPLGSVLRPVGGILRIVGSFLHTVGVLLRPIGAPLNPLDVRVRVGRFLRLVLRHHGLNRGGDFSLGHTGLAGLAGVPIVVVRGRVIWRIRPSCVGGQGPAVGLVR